MKLNPDCIRDLLMECEEQCTPYQSAAFTPQEPFVRDGREYSWEETLYHLEQCRMSGFFSGASRDIVDTYRVTDITPKAHEFLANIRNDNIWKATKGMASKVGSFSLDILKSCAATVVSEIIKGHLGV